MLRMLFFLLPADQDTPSPKSKPVDVLPAVPRLPNFASTADRDASAPASAMGDSSAPASAMGGSSARNDSAKGGSDVALTDDGWLQCPPEASFGSKFCENLCLKMVWSPLTSWV